MMEALFDPALWISLFTLTVMEIVLGIDNIIFITILAGRLPMHQQAKARNLGLTLALGIRVILLLFISWLAGLTDPLFVVFEQGISVRDLIMIVGGLFLMGKSTMEIHHKLEGDELESGTQAKGAVFSAILVQILLLDIVFSLDSIITAIGLVKEVGIMIAAVTISMIVMLIFAGAIGAFINKHPTLKMLALSFLLMIGLVLLLEGFGKHVPKGYIYFAMAFSFIVEMLNLRLRKPALPNTNSQSSEKQEE
jgi:predicted tellurium resistance membrane protein TerC